MNKKITLPASDDLDEAPICTDDDFKNAAHRIGLKPLPQKKQKINITLDPDVVACSSSKPEGADIRRLSMPPYEKPCRKKTIEETIRQVIREELRSS